MFGVSYRTNSTAWHNAPNSGKAVAAVAASTLVVVISIYPQRLFGLADRIKVAWNQWREKRRWHATDVQPAYVYPTRFVPTDAEGIQAHLKEHGYAVVASVLTPAECKRALALMWDWLEAAAPQPGQLQRDYPSTWHHWPPTVEGGILPYRGAGQSKVAWFVRSRLLVACAFASVWGSDAPLVTSFDGISAWRPWQMPPSPSSASCAISSHKAAARAAPAFQALWLRLRAAVDGAWETRRRCAWRTEAGWFHIDQNPLLKPGFLCVQGLVSLLPTAPGRGGNVLVAKSHRLFPERYLKLYRAEVDEVDGDDWFALPRHDPMLHKSIRTTSMMKENGTEQQEDLMVCTVALEAGDLLLWDSRTVHCSSPGSDGRPLAVNDSDSSESATRKPQSGDNAGSLEADSRYTPKGGVGAPLLRAAVMVCMAPIDRLASAAALDRKHANLTTAVGDNASNRDATASPTNATASTTDSSSPCDSADYEDELLANLLRRRKEAVEQGWTTPHWPHKATPLLEQYHEDVVGTGEAEQQRLLRSPVAERLTYSDLGPHERSLVDGEPRGAA